MQNLYPQQKYNRKTIQIQIDQKNIFFMYIFSEG